ncbi:carbohydrate ABC transporter permease [Paenibacillus xanthanilyticus]|uniref:Carbohydrate ABC transporter permease n=1 Tax=Paenibacillus xanthanilyticus TaxID=1783531 RepID=A0ABV8JZ00_9BACL
MKLAKRAAWPDVVFSGLNYVVLLGFGLLTLYPFVNLLAISLNDGLDSLRGGIYLIPRQFTLYNYVSIFQNDGLLKAAGMSVARTLLGTLLGVLGTAMVAYSLSRRDFVLRKPLNVIIVFTMFVNAGLLPFYLLIRDLGLMNQFWVYILPGLISAYNVIIIRSYFESLPDGIVESARMDGASEFQTLFRIVLPVSMPVVATVSLFIAVGHWNAWFDNYLYTSSNENLDVLQFELMKILQTTQGQVVNGNNGAAAAVKGMDPDATRAAMTMIVSLPILCVYPFLQKYFVKGIMVASMKE